MEIGRAERNTIQRKVILEELQKLTMHPTASDLYSIVKSKLPKISLGTIYRNLDILSQKGIIHKLDTSGAQSRYDADVKTHYHVRCVRCNRLDDIHELPDDLTRAHAPELESYKVIGCQLQFFGVCRDCQLKEGGN